MLTIDQKPKSPLQRAATSLGTTQDGRIHLGGVRWDIAENQDGSLQEQGVFRDAFIQADKVSDVYLAVKPFTDKPGGYPGHAQLHFAFPKDAPVTDSLGNQDQGLVLSVEIHFDQGSEDYDPDKDTPILYQVGTWSDSLEKATVYHRYPLQLYKLQLNQEQKVDLLKERLEAATQDHTKDFYHPVTNSCLSTLIDGVNKVVPDHQKIDHNDANAKVPVWCPKAFKKYHLIAQTRPDLNYPAQPKA
jgi:hypothetical protein